MEQLYTIYVFALENNNFYVGLTEDLPFLLENLPSNEWMTKYSFQEIIETFKGEKYDEYKTLLKYMGKHGINSVRGGKFTNLVLTSKEYLDLRRYIFYYSDRCVACGDYGHTTENCADKVCYVCHEVGHTVEGCIMKNTFQGCTRCGRESHWAFRCNRSKDIYGRHLEKCNLM